jgi:hypothetical protein
MARRIWESVSGPEPFPIASALLFSQALEVSPAIADHLREPGTGLYFDWGPDSARYLTHVDKRPPSPDPEHLLDFLSVPPRLPGQG